MTTSDPLPSAFNASHDSSRSAVNALPVKSGYAANHFDHSSLSQPAIYPPQHHEGRARAVTDTRSVADHAAAAALVELQSWAKPHASQNQTTVAPFVPAPLRNRSTTLPTSNQPSPPRVLRKPLPTGSSHIAGRYATSATSTPTSTSPPLAYYLPASRYCPPTRTDSLPRPSVSASNTGTGLPDPQNLVISTAQAVPFFPSTDPLSPPQTIKSNVSVRQSVISPASEGSIITTRSRPTSNERSASYQHTSYLSDAPKEEEAVKHPLKKPQSLIMNTFRMQSNRPGSSRSDDRGTPVREEPPALSIIAPKKESPQKNARKISSFFAWKSAASPKEESPTTPFSEEPMSPAASPMPVLSNVVSYSKGMLAPLDVSRANASLSSQYSPASHNLPLPTPPGSSHQFAELEQELREITQELAQSVRREMELEDEIERLKSDKPSNNLDTERRNSDYYSDSGAGSVRYPASEVDGSGRIEELEMLRRKTEQDKAQMKLDMSKRLEGALRMNRDLEDKVRQVESRSRSPARDDSAKVKELEAAVLAAQRKASDERQFRESYESLIAGMRLEMEQFRKERDNLLQDVVPQLETKIESFEQEASSVQSLTYENSRLQQELATLKLQVEARLEEDDGPSPAASPALGGFSRSKSVLNRRGGVRSRSNSVLSRSNSLREAPLARSDSMRKEAPQESRDDLSQRVKDLQEQRDALHSTVKSLILRHDHMEADHAKRMRKAEQEREKQQALTPRRTAYQTEVRNLREEVTSLRRRADDALNQKWQCEKGLGGLKMDLDRAQAETTSLRHLLQTKSPISPSDAHSSIPSLDRALDELRSTQVLSLASMQQLDSKSGDSTPSALDLLKQSISSAEAERDHAVQEANQYRSAALTLHKAELEHLSKESALATDLYASAQRMDVLATEVQSQMQSNSSLRARLADAIGRGEQEQGSSKERIKSLQVQLKDLENSLVIAQQHSEDVIATHEDEIRNLKAAHNAQLQRAAPKPLAVSLSPMLQQTASGLAITVSPAMYQSPSMLMPPTPLTPLFAVGKTPRLDKTSSGLSMTMHEATRTGALEAKVQELESKLQEAEGEMSEVVSRMNRAQIEVAELQAERDEAMMRTRRLQTAMQTEREKVKELIASSSLNYPDDY